ncbi:excisionase [Massilia antarctica]|uniref:Excisionase n=1 Tax=Massilia antarctica TaxID=2765360 RepID=A0AA48WI89_9BURK|nr:excisionase [Massilia antarctica]QPI52886.1 excisionase [Massilia antarctica]
MRWVKLKKYCELSGETSDAVHSKRRKGQFIDGIHSKIAGDGNLWINVEAVEKWVEQGSRSAISVLRAG